MHSAFLKGVEGRKRLDIVPGTEGMQVQCGTDTDRSLESTGATENMERGPLGVTLRLVMQQSGGREWMGLGRGRKGVGEQPGCTLGKDRLRDWTRMGPAPNPSPSTWALGLPGLSFALTTD